MGVNSSMFGFVTAIVGLSLILGLAGVNTAGGSVLNLFMDTHIDPVTGNYTLNGFEKINQFQNSMFAGIFALLAGAIGIGLIVLSGKFDIAGSMKVAALLIFEAMAILDLASIFSYTNNISDFGGLVTIVSWVIYVPLTVGFFIVSLDWIGGGR